jgi:hypothetical protein
VIDQEELLSLDLPDVEGLHADVMARTGFRPAVLRD